MNSLIYFVPLSSPKETDYIMNGEKKEIRKSIIPIIRIVTKDNQGNLELKGTLKFSNMIPVPDCALLTYDVELEIDKNYKVLILKELAFISDNTDKIFKHARVIYNQKNRSLNINYLKETVDFILLEQKCKEYEEWMVKLTQEAAATKE